MKHLHTDVESIGELRKRKKRIDAYLSTVRVKTLKDELAIIQYCHRFLGIKIKSIPSGIDLPEITFECFLNWLNQVVPGEGDIIELVGSKFICIVKFTDVSKFRICAKLNLDNELSIIEEDIPICDFNPASIEGKKRLQIALYQKKLIWSSYKIELLEMVQPNENQQVRITLLGEKKGLGVFREINEKNEIVMFCVKMDNEGFRYSLHEIIGFAWDYQLEMISTNEREEFATVIQQSKFIWNGHAKRIEPINYRVKKGEPYNFITDKFEVNVAQDNYRPSDLRRLQTGNYFQFQKEAEDMVNHIYSKLMCIQNRRVEKGELYYYINTNLGVSKSSFKNNIKDVTRIKRGNFFIGNSEANNLIKLIVEYRKNQLIQFYELYPDYKYSARKKT
ncbi:hypothetical protein [Dysgonomonas sp. GY617]|uniref:hypothetical protein n=1 Tax=Dysgonomonas sp. GY617 TaxID=2780420 RepID=UPI0018831D5F|nr:hypothetical protein [Dysgonomonas sp. GY617]MBF0577405.1 hypothetical protein [Dysgonomonas sp. GY617]